ncbi:recombinase family protein [Novosphingobium resinovorum]|uniref:recombinase family protein n=1 Tax=Novosphingobium resinovorum TaxID=158500 RepID=UPI002ED16CF0|nr:recombinase family protein [Novosphingobium resinovorum]
MMWRILAPFDEYQLKENAKHVMRILKKNARQGFRNCAMPSLGYRIAAGRPNSKKKLEIDSVHPGILRVIYRHALQGEGGSGLMGFKVIISHVNRNRIFTYVGGRWGIGQLHRTLTRRIYIGEQEFNKRSKSKELKAVSGIVVEPVPRLIDEETFDAVQEHLPIRNSKVTPPRVVGGPTLLTGICFQ